MKPSFWLIAILMCIFPTGLLGQEKLLIDDLERPKSVALGGNGKIYVSVYGDAEKDLSGAILVIENGNAKPFVTGLHAPHSLTAYQQWLFVADKDRILKIDLKGKVDVFAPTSAFPSPPIRLVSLTIDAESGTLYVAEGTNLDGKGGAVYRISPKGKVTVLTDRKRLPNLHLPQALALDGASHLLIADNGNGQIIRVRLTDLAHERIEVGSDPIAGLAWDRYGRLFISNGEDRIFGIARPGEKPTPLPAEFTRAGQIAVDDTGKFLLIPDLIKGTVTRIPAVIPGFEVNDTPLSLETAVAFPELKWTGWQAETPQGKIDPLRPIVLTHAGDGSNRVFVATQQGVIHVFPNDQKAKETKVFLNIQDKVRYQDNENEEGFLGLTFHPKYKENGEFFVYYTPKKEKLINVVSRFRVSKDDPNRADPASEEEIIRFKRPFWNHDGGTICFGPDGYLYIAVGDGGAANDPYNNGQNLNSLLGKILRIDVDRKDPDLNYAIPKDNPFVNKADARPETWAYGLRNVWRMAFDRKTGVLWAGDVGQNLYEEINLIVKGGNYGWKLREGLHPFEKGSRGRTDLIDPIWEYHHDVGKSITGGNVYRGKRLPELDGAYIYGDYVTNKIWALRYDEKKKRVVANQPIRDRSLPILSFGEDEEGEVYLMTFSVSGKGIFRFEKNARGQPKGQSAFTGSQAALGNPLHSKLRFEKPTGR